MKRARSPATVGTDEALPVTVDLQGFGGERVGERSSPRDLGVTDSLLIPAAGSGDAPR